MSWYSRIVVDILRSRPGIRFAIGYVPNVFFACVRKKKRSISPRNRRSAFRVLFLTFFNFLPICVFSCIFSLALVRDILFSDSVSCSYPLYPHIFHALLFLAEWYIAISAPCSSVLALSQFLSVLCSWWYFSRIWLFAKCFPSDIGCALKCFTSYSTSVRSSSYCFLSSLYYA